MSLRGIRIGTSQQSGRSIFDHSDRHMLTIGGSGTGKTSSALIPAAVEHPGSLIVVSDINCELCAVTAHGRRRFGPVYQMNPFGMYQDRLKDIPSVGYNPLRLVKPGSLRATAMAGKIAAGCVTMSEDKHNYFDRSAMEVVLKSCILGEAFRGTMPYLHEIARRIGGNFREYAKELCEVDNDFVRTSLSRFLEAKSDLDSRYDIIDTARSQMQFVMDDAIGQFLSRDNSPGFAECRRRPTTYYIILPLDVLSDVGKFFRLMLSCILAELYDQEAAGSVETLILCDEYPRVANGGLPEMADAFSAIRKFKTKLWICVNGARDLVDIHGEAKTATMFQDAGVVQWLSAKGQNSETLSGMSGDSEAHTRGKSVGIDLSKPDKSPSINETWGQVSRKLLLPHEAAALGKHEQIVFLDGVPGPLKLNKTPYWAIPEVRQYTRANPYYEEKA